MLKKTAKLISLIIVTILCGYWTECFANDNLKNCYLGSYKGQVLEIGTGKPIENAVIHVTYGRSSVAYTPGAAVHKLVTNAAVRETITDANGEFVIPADRIYYECPSGKLSGKVQIFKSGYGTIGDFATKRFCIGKDNEKQKNCDIEFDKYITYELPSHKEVPWRRATLKKIAPANKLLDDQQQLLLSAIKKESEYLTQAKDGKNVLAVEPFPFDGKTKFSPLLVSIKENETNKAISLIKSGVDVNERDLVGFTPLIYASRFNNIQLVELLIEKGAEVNVANDMGRTPLIEAVINNNREVANLLISSGASLKPYSYLKKERTGGNLHSRVETFGKNKEVKLPVGRGGAHPGQSKKAEIREQKSLTIDPLTAALRGGQYEMAEYLLEKYYDKNNYQQQLDDALFAALEQKKIQKQTISLLMDKGAAINRHNPHDFTPLIIATYQGKTEAIELLLSRGAEVDVVNYLGHSPLLIAIDKNRKDVVSLLLNHGASVSPLPYKRKNNDNTVSEKITIDPIEQALLRKRDEIARLLVDSNAELSKEKLEDSFIKALRNGQLQLADGLINRGADVNMEISPGIPILHAILGKIDQMGRGIISKRKDTVVYLCRKGARVNGSDRQEYSPLHYAAKDGDVDIARTLLEHGADINALSERYGTPIYVAAKSYKLEMVHYLLVKGADPNISNPLLTNIVKEPDIVKLLLETNVDPHVVDSSNRTPLFLAVQKNGSIDSVKMLLEAGLNPNHQKSDGTTPLKVALESKNLEIAQLLFEYEADIKADCMKGIVVAAMSDLYKVTGRFEKETIRAKRAKEEMAAGIIGSHQSGSIIKNAERVEVDFEKKERIFKFLVESGAELNNTSGNGLTPIMYAAQIGRLDYLQFLLDNGAEIDIHDNNGDTALMKATQANDLKVVVFLINNGADVRTKNKEGLSPYWIAKRNGNQEIADLLVKHGADTISYKTHIVKIKAFQATGLLPSEISAADISPVELKYYLLTLATYGIDEPEQYKPDLRLSDPVKTWELHKQAFDNNDFTLLKKTLARPDHPLIEIFEAFSPEKRQELVKNMRDIERIVQDENSAKFRIHKSIKGEEITFYIYFSKMFGEWKIEDY